MVLQRRPKTGQYKRYTIRLTPQEIKRLQKAARASRMSSRYFAATQIIQGSNLILDK